MQAISLYWFVSTFGRQKFGLLYVEFSAEFNELSLKGATKLYYTYYLCIVIIFSIRIHQNLCFLLIILEN